MTDHVHVHWHEEHAAIRTVLTRAGWTPDTIDTKLRRWSRIRERSRRHRARLRRAGATDARIWSDADQIRYDGLVELVGEDLARRIVYALAPEQPDDRAYRPRYVDPVLRGAARATGETARAVKARSTIRIDDHRDYREDRPA